MWNFVAKLFMTFGVIEFVGSIIFLWGYFWGSLKAGLLMDFIISFSIQIILGLALYFLGDHMLRIYSEEQTIKHVFKEIDK